MRLFYFPYAGANATVIANWQDSLGTTVELCVAQLPGHGARLFEEPLDELDALVADLAAAVADLADRRFAFFGHSLGALVAFEVARSLRRQGLPMPERLWASGAEAPRTRVIQRRIADLPHDELIEALRDYSGTPAEVLADQEIMELLLPGIRADFALSERYAYSAEPPLDLPIHVLRGAQDSYVEATRAADWAQETTWSPRMRVYPAITSSSLPTPPTSPTSSSPNCPASARTRISRCRPGRSGARRWPSRLRGVLGGRPPLASTAGGSGGSSPPGQHCGGFWGVVPPGQHCGGVWVIGVRAIGVRDVPG